MRVQQISADAMTARKADTFTDEGSDELRAEARTILLVDDADASRVTTKWFLANFGYTVESVPNAEQALQVFNPKVHDIVITDNRMPGMTGVELAHIIKLRSQATPVLMYTSLAPQDQSCLDLVIERPTHLLKVKEGVDRLISRPPLRG